MDPAPLSSQFPNLSGSQSNYDPAQFLLFLRSLVKRYLGDDCHPIPLAKKDDWVTIVNGLADHFLGSFYLPDDVSWEAMQERLEITEATLEVVRRVFLRVEGIYNDSEELIRKMFVRLLDLCRVLDLWVGSAVQNEEVKEFRETVFSVLVSILRGLGCNNPVPEQQRSSWETLRGILQAGIDVCNGKGCFPFRCHRMLIPLQMFFYRLHPFPTML